MAYTGWALPEWEKLSLLEAFPPAYPDVIAHHVTFSIGKKKDLPDLPTEEEGTIVGIADDGIGIQALVVEIGGSTARGEHLPGTYHITWSMDAAAGYSAKMSNDVIAEGWTKVDPVRITLVPKFFPY